jgi:hypothetical protein
MEGNARTWFTPKQKAELWERWKNGQCVAESLERLGGGTRAASKADIPLILADVCFTSESGHG